MCYCEAASITSERYHVYECMLGSWDVLWNELEFNLCFGTRPRWPRLTHRSGVFINKKFTTLVKTVISRAERPQDQNFICIALLTKRQAL